MFSGELTFPVSDIEGIGSASVQSLGKLGIFNIAQLIRHYPVRYIDRITPVSLAQSSTQKPAVTVAEVISHDTFHWKNGQALKIFIRDESETASMLCYGRNYLAKKLPAGKMIRITGPFTRNKYGEIQSGSFVFEDLAMKALSKEFNLIQPIYRLGGNLTQGLLRKVLKSVIARYAFNLRNELPPEIIHAKKFKGKAEYIRNIHFPATMQEAAHARNALIYEELFHLQIAVARRHISSHGLSSAPRPWNEDLPDRLRKTLPFTLTTDQRNAINDIIEDFKRPGPMLRLLQGEVGSGKTLVAFIASLGVIGEGRQAAFMAPTELLARQHADNAARLMQPLGVRSAFLAGELNTSSRRSLTDALATGEIDLVIGTHALFSSGVVFKDLALVIIDEQQRFGVGQRRALAEKGQSPDILAMSATPIPRTLTLTAFGDMDVSSIRTMPKGRFPIETHLTRIGNEMKVYEFVRRELAAGNRAYFVYPLIEESEKTNIKDAENMFNHLKTQVFPDFKGAIIHSRIDEDSKKRIMTDFRDGHLDYITATSVVEVGVDVAEATCMVVEHAECFGLSALHQLRGRVGRGNRPSYCFLVYNEPLTMDGKARLMTMKNVSDGFILAEEDLKIRGPGDMAGVRQSGFLRLAIADPVRDLQILLEARKDARAILRDDPELEEERHGDFREFFEKHPPFDENLLSTL